MAASMSGTLTLEKLWWRMGGRWGGRRGWGNREYLLTTANEVRLYRGASVFALRLPHLCALV